MNSIPLNGISVCRKTIYFSTECHDFERTAKTVIVSTTIAHSMVIYSAPNSDSGEVPQKAIFMVARTTTVINENGRIL